MARKRVHKDQGALHEPEVRTADVLSALDRPGTKAPHPGSKPPPSAIAQNGLEARAPAARFTAGEQIRKEHGVFYPRGRSRRAFLIQSAAGVGWLALHGRLLAAPATSGDSGRSLRLTTTGGDRATGYVMSNKIARRDGHLICTWLDAVRQNRWALVDLEHNAILQAGAPDKPRRDNHCGAAITTDIDGTLHLLIGAHHDAFVHYRLPPGRRDWEAVEDGRAVGQTATYPSLVCDGHGTLHLLYRRETNGSDAHLVYCRRPKSGPWSAPRLLVRMAVREHSWLTNAIEVGPTGRLHAVFSNTLPVPGQGTGARYYGASHIYSDDSGQTWHQFGGAALGTLPAAAAQLQRIEGTALATERIEARYGGKAGPLNSYYHKMALSNPAIDQHDRPWVIVHNLLAGDAGLYRHGENGRWEGVPLAEPVGARLPGYRIRHCGQLSRHRDGTIEAVLMVSPEAGPGWGDPGTALVRLRLEAGGRLLHSSLVRPAEPGLPSWMPSLERWCWHAPLDRPALLYTRGLNAGGYSNNVNNVNTEVWLDWG